MARVLNFSSDNSSAGKPVGVIEVGGEYYIPHYGETYMTEDGMAGLDLRGYYRATYDESEKQEEQMENRKRLWRVVGYHVPSERYHYHFLTARTDEEARFEFLKLSTEVDTAKLSDWDFYVEPLIVLRTKKELEDG